MIMFENKIENVGFLGFSKKILAQFFKILSAAI